MDCSDKSFEDKILVLCHNVFFISHIIRDTNIIQELQNYKNIFINHVNILFFRLSEFNLMSTVLRNGGSRKLQE